MTEAAAAVVNKPAWVDLASSDPAASREFYGRLFGWSIEVSPDPQYGGYAMAQIDGRDVAGIGGLMSPGAPSAWSIYIGTPNAEDLGSRAQAAGGTVIAPAFDVGDQGRMTVLQDPTGAFISAWEPRAMPGFSAGSTGEFAWAELSARGVEKAVMFYRALFGWAPRTTEMGEGVPPYTEFLLGDESVAGAQEMNPAAPADMPSYWLAYFNVDDVDGSYAKALDMGAREMLPPMDFPGGRFAVVSDPQGAAFGLLKFAPRS